MKLYGLTKALLVLQVAACVVTGFVSPSSSSSQRPQHIAQFTASRPETTRSDARFLGYSPLRVSSTSSSSSTAGDTPAATKPGAKTIKELRAEGGFLTFNTPIGALNPFAIYYGLMSIFLGIPWYISLKFTQLLYWVSRGKFDKKRRIPVFLSHVWGVTLLRLSRSFPKIENKEVLKKLYDSNQHAMFVANHCSWMDIPFLGATVGWRNYKLVSKKELGIIPILGTAIRTGGNLLLDRTDRRSQFKTLKQGINLLEKENVHLCTFPEGTRSRNGRLLKFKNGAFKMAYKAGAPVVPISIVGSQKVMPTGWMFSMKPARGTARVVVHEPVESKGKTEEELAAAVRESMISGLPDDQKPL